jgi:hypothetical protein
VRALPFCAALSFTKNGDFGLVASCPGELFSLDPRKQWHRPRSPSLCVCERKPFFLSTQVHLPIQLIENAVRCFDNNGEIKIARIRIDSATGKELILTLILFCLPPRSRSLDELIRLRKTSRSVVSPIQRVTI